MNRSTILAVVIAFGFGAVATGVVLRMVDPLEMTFSTIDGGGGTSTSGDGVFQLSGTIGQPDAGVMSGDNFTLSGGFWAAAAAIPAQCEGDANLDGAIDAADTGFIQARFGCDVNGADPTCAQADVNGDGAVDAADTGFVQARFGNPCP